MHNAQKLKESSTPKIAIYARKFQLSAEETRLALTLTFSLLNSYLIQIKSLQYTICLFNIILTSSMTWTENLKVLSRLRRYAVRTGNDNTAEHHAKPARRIVSQLARIAATPAPPRPEHVGEKSMPTHHLIVCP